MLPRLRPEEPPSPQAYDLPISLIREGYRGVFSATAVRSVSPIMLGVLVELLKRLRCLPKLVEALIRAGGTLKAQGLLLGANIVLLSVGRLLRRSSAC